MAWIQIRTNVLLVLILIQTVCKGYQQMTEVIASKERVEDSMFERVYLPQYCMDHFQVNIASF